MEFSFKDKLNLVKPVVVSVNWFDPNDNSYGSTNFKLESVEEKQDKFTIHTISISIYVLTNKKQDIVVIDNTNKRRSDTHIVNKKFSSYDPKLIGEYKIVINNEDDVFAITKEDWQTDATKYVRNHKNVDVLVHHLTYDDKDYRDIKIKTYRDIFYKLLDLNKQSIFKNPTISLLLHLISIGDSNYSSVFIEWFEEQFTNDKLLKTFGKKYAKFRKAFGNTYVQEYHALKKKAKANTGLNEVAEEKPILCVVTKLETTIEDDVKPVIEEPQQVTKPIDTTLTHSYALSGQSVSASETNDLLFEELASEGFFDDDDNNRSIGRINKYIVWRQGQNEFRQKLLEAYSCCAITGCISEEALEAAHIEPYSKTKNNDPKNGLLLRADIHTLFDRHLIGIDSETMTVYVAQSLLEDYGQFNGKSLQLPEDKHLRPDKEALKIRYEEYKKRLDGYY